METRLPLEPELWAKTAAPAAAWRISSRAAANWMLMSASIHWRPWNSQIGRPN